MTETETVPIPATPTDALAPNGPSRPQYVPRDTAFQRQFPPRPKIRSGRGITQAVQAAVIQRFAFDASVALRDELSKAGELKVSRDDAQALAQLVRAWDTARDAVRILKGKGLPAAVRSKPSKKADGGTAATEAEPTKPA